MRFVRSYIAYDKSHIIAPYPRAERCELELYELAKFSDKKIFGNKSEPNKITKNNGRISGKKGYNY